MSSTYKVQTVLYVLKHIPIFSHALELSFECHVKGTDFIFNFLPSFTDIANTHLTNVSICLTMHHTSCSVYNLFSNTCTHIPFFSSLWRQMGGAFYLHFFHM